jgi:hypothetical protein
MWKAVLVLEDFLRRLPPRVVQLPSELATDLPSSLIVSVSGSLKRTVCSEVRGMYSDNALERRVDKGCIGLS